MAGSNPWLAALVQSNPSSNRGAIGPQEPAYKGGGSWGMSRPSPDILRTVCPSLQPPALLLLHPCTTEPHPALTTPLPLIVHYPPYPKPQCRHPTTSLVARATSMASRYASTIHPTRELQLIKFHSLSRSPVMNPDAKQSLLGIYPATRKGSTTRNGTRRCILHTNVPYSILISSPLVTISASSRTATDRRRASTVSAR